MYRLEEGALPLIFASVLDQVAETSLDIRGKMTIPSPPLVIKLDETGTPASSRSLSLQHGVKITSILLRLEDHQVVCWKKG